MAFRIIQIPGFNLQNAYFYDLTRIRPQGIYGTDFKKYSHHRFRIGGLTTSDIFT